MIDPLRFAIAMIPLASYLLLIGAINRSSKPVLVSGASDLAALAAALTGLAFIGPIELFRPDAASGVMGNYIWLSLLVFYWLSVALVVMLCRPRLVIYNSTAKDIRPALVEAVSQIDSEARWAGDSLVLPTLEVQLHLDSHPMMRTVSLVASGGQQNLLGWRRLEKSLGRSLRTVSSAPSQTTGILLVSGITLLLISVLAVASDPQAVMVTWKQLSSF